MKPIIRCFFTGLLLVLLTSYAYAQGTQSHISQPSLEVVSPTGNRISQSTCFKFPRHSIQVDVGLASTFHINPIVPVVQCIEGCTVYNQKARYAPTASIAYYKRVGKWHGIKLGGSYGEYRYWELGQGSTGSHNLTGFERTLTHRAWAVELGHRLIIPIGRAMPYIENNILGERLPSEYATISPNNIAYKARVGILSKISSSMFLNFNAFFKTGLTQYNEVAELPKTYRPYAIGLELGLMRGL